MPSLPPDCKSLLNKFRRKGVPVCFQDNAFLVSDPELDITTRKHLGNDPRENLARAVRTVLAKRVVKILEEAAPNIPRFKAEVHLTLDETFCVEIRAHFAGGTGIANCLTPIFREWPSQEAIASIGRELEAPYKHLLSLCAYLDTTEQSWILDDNVVSVLGCYVTATADGKIALETSAPVTNYDDIRKVILMLRRGYPRYLKKLKAELSHPKEETPMEYTLDLV